MPKPGYTVIVVKESVRSGLQELASRKGYGSINQLLEAWIGVNPQKKSISRFFWCGGRDLNPRRPTAKAYARGS